MAERECPQVAGSRPGGRYVQPTGAGAERTCEALRGGRRRQKVRARVVDDIVCHVDDDAVAVLVVLVVLT